MCINIYIYIFTYILVCVYIYIYIYSHSDAKLHNYVRYESYCTSCRIPTVTPQSHLPPGPAQISEVALARVVHALGQRLHAGLDWLSGPTWRRIVAG